MADLRCEWPAQRGALAKCGRPAKGYVQNREVPDTSEPNPWGRHVCGIHLRRATAIGWVEVND